MQILNSTAGALLAITGWLLTSGGVRGVASLLQESYPPELNQLPFVVAMMIFAGWIWTQHRIDRAEDRGSWQMFLDRETARHDELLKAEREGNRHFLVEQREAMNSALGRLAEELKASRLETVKSLTEVGSLLERHDRRAATFIAQEQVIAGRSRRADDEDTGS